MFVSFSAKEGGNTDQSKFEKRQKLLAMLNSVIEEKKRDIDCSSCDMNNTRKRRVDSSTDVLSTTERKKPLLGDYLSTSDNVQLAGDSAVNRLRRSLPSDLTECRRRHSGLFGGPSTSCLGTSRTRLVSREYPLSDVKLRPSHRHNGHNTS